MRIRLISTSARRLRVLLLMIDTLLLTTICSFWSINLLIGHALWNQLLLIIDTASVLLAALVIRCATADSEDPEETASDAKGNSEPCNSEEMGIDRGLDSVRFGGCFDGTDCNGREDGSHDRCGNDSGGTETRDDVCNA